MQRFAEVQHIGFARRIDGVARHGLKPEQAGHEQDVSGAALRHVVRVHVRQFRQRDDVELQHVRGARQRLPDELPVEAVSGIVDQQVDHQALRVRPGLEGRRSIGRGQVHRLHDDPHLVLAPQPLGQLFHRLRAAGHENHIGPLCGEEHRELHTKSARRAGDERPFPGHAVSLPHRLVPRSAFIRILSFPFLTFTPFDDLEIQHKD